MLSRLLRMLAHTLGLHRFAVWTAAWTFLLLLAGGLVHATGSSLACPDWPLCYGSALPRMVGGVAIEHSHRLLATFVGINTIVTALFAWRVGRDRKDTTLVRVGALGLALVVVQGVLGGVTVLLRLPTAVSTAHLATSMIFFSTMIFIAVRAAGPVLPRDARFASLGRLAAIATGLVYVQLLVGALVRHTASALGCGTDVVLCGGTVLPTTGPGVLIYTHRVLGLAVALFAIYVGVRASRVGRKVHGAPKAFLWIGIALPLLVCAQLTLGVLSVVTVVSPPIVVAHLGGGALLLAATWTLHLATRFGGLVRAERDPDSLVIGEARVTT